MARKDFVKGFGAVVSKVLENPPDLSVVIKNKEVIKKKTRDHGFKNINDLAMPTADDPTTPTADIADSPNNTKSDVGEDFSHEDVQIMTIWESVKGRKKHVVITRVMPKHECLEYCDYPETSLSKYTVVNIGEFKSKFVRQMFAV